MNLQKLSMSVESDRNEKWEDQFLTALAEAQISVMTPDPIEGPDGWPYLFISTDTEPATSEPAQKVIKWLSTRGIGLAVNPHKEMPDFILSYGMLWSFCETGKFIHRDKAAGKKQINEQVEYTKANLRHAGTPTEQYLPTYVRSILRDFFRDQNIFDPRALLLSQDNKNYDLAFSAESIGSPKESEWAGIAEAISWFLPSHYSLVIISEKDLPEFISL